MVKISDRHRETMPEPAEKPAETAVEVNQGQDNKAETGGHVFNEQTNYVPRRTIITVWDVCCRLVRTMHTEGRKSKR